MSNRNPNNFSDFQKICTRYVTYPEEPHSGSGAASRQRTLKINLKLNHHLIFNKDSVGLIAGQIYICAFAELGNASPITASTLPYIANLNQSTGFQYNMHTIFYYVDN